MGVSILDIAALAGVSKSTVSAVINNHPSVRPETRERVMKAIVELDYHPNIAARELITASPMNIGIILPTYGSSSPEKGDRYFKSINESSNLELVSLLTEKISKTKYGILVEHAVISESEPFLPSFVSSRRVSGVFQISPLLCESYIKKLGMYVPSVVEIGTASEEVDSVYTDFEEIGRLSVDYLVGRGHRKIAFINCDPSSRTVKNRLDGYISGLKKNKIEYNEQYVQNSPFSGEGGYEAFSKIWNGCSEKPTALICATSTIGSGAMRFMNEKGIKVPDDISVVCNSDGVLAEFSYPRLTSVSRDKAEVAEKAFDLMMERLKDNSLPPRTVKTEIHIIERESVRNIF